MEYQEPYNRQGAKDEDDEMLSFEKTVTDAVRWSVNGRYAIAAISLLSPSKDDFCKIKVWDTTLQRFNDDLSAGTDLKVPKNTFLL